MPVSVAREPAVLAGYLLRYRFSDSDVNIDPDSFLRETNPSVIGLLQDAVQSLHGIKFQIRISVAFFKPTDDSKKISRHFVSDQKIGLPASNLQQSARECYAKILERIENFEGKGSGWSIENIISSTLHIGKYAPIKGSSYIPLPKKLAAKQAIVNVKNNDHMCFLWSILASLHPVARNPQRPQKYLPFFNELDTSQLVYPVTFDQIDAFSERNDISIGLYGYNRHVYPLLLPERIRQRHVNLLYITDGTDSHYCYIKDLNALLFDRNFHKNRKFYCQVCLRAFYFEDQHADHERFCQANRQKISVPSSDFIVFDDYRKMIRKPYVIYADFECLLEPVSSAAPSPSTSFSMSQHEHTPSGFALIDVINCCSKTAQEPGNVHVYRGPDALENFFQQILQHVERYQTVLRQRNRVLTMRDADRHAHQQAIACHLCGKDLDTDKVADHCHVCGEYVGAAHSICNIQSQMPGDVPVLFHNLRKYDGHLLMQHIGNVAHEHGYTIDCIPKGLDDYITFSLIKRDRGKIVSRIRFMDTCQFLPASLDHLVQNLAKGGADKFPILRSVRRQNVDLLLRKGVFPYEYMTDAKKFDETHLPAIENFYSTLKDETISQEDFDHAQNVWNTFSIKNLGEYQDLYVETDTLLLADVFQNFRSFCFENYKLDPCQFFTLPSFGWAACLLMTGVKLELLKDIDMYTFFEKGLRGGVSVICHRHALANNPVLGNFDNTLPESYIIYLDANNLYGWGMIQHLPVSEFRWLTRNDIDALDIGQIADDNDTGYVLEVDLEYPADLHDQHNCYPLAPERMKVPYSMMSPYCQRLHEQLQVQGADAEKLVPNLYEKQNYIVHYRNLKFYLEMGLRIRRIHRVVAFKQQDWLKPYINFNTEKRKNATSEFDKDLYKLLNNSIFGKSCENVRNYRDIRLVTEPDQFVKLVRKREFQRCEVFYDNLVAVELLKEEVVLNKPIYTGFTIMDLSKLLMYDFHYKKMDRLRESFDVRLLFTDTDSLCYHMVGEDLYNKLAPHADLFDFSDYPAGHMLHSSLNKKVMGKMKDETASVPIREFVGIRAKMYSMDCGDHEKKRAKGVTKAVIKKRLTHALYLSTLRNEEIRRDKMTRISSVKHQLNTTCFNKISLSPFDNKRYLLGDGISSYAYGHKNIAQ